MKKQQEKELSSSSTEEEEEEETGGAHTQFGGFTLFMLGYEEKKRHNF